MLSSSSSPSLHFHVVEIFTVYYPANCEWKVRTSNLLMYEISENTSDLNYYSKANYFTFYNRYILGIHVRLCMVFAHGLQNHRLENHVNAITNQNTHTFKMTYCPRSHERRQNHQKIRSLQTTNSPRWTLLWFSLLFGCVLGKWKSFFYWHLFARNIRVLRPAVDISLQRYSCPSCTLEELDAMVANDNTASCNGNPKNGLVPRCISGQITGLFNGSVWRRKVRYIFSSNDARDSL